MKNVSGKWAIALACASLVAGTACAQTMSTPVLKMAGTITGMTIRNYVVLMAQIKDYEDEGMARGKAIVEATMHRLRPILLTAAAAILGLIPIATEVFWGPMAVAMMGGLAVATVLTLIFLPALYAAWYGVPRADFEENEKAPGEDDRQVVSPGARSPAY